MIGGWKYAAASVIGTSHLTSSQGVCQDFSGCVYLDGPDVLVCVVSDGAGSASRSDQGSRLTCELVLRQVSSAIPEIIHSRCFALETLSLLQQELLTVSAATGLRLRDFACTLLVAIAGKHQVTFWQIGDGAICFRIRTNQDFHYAFWPFKGEYANVTQFVTDDKADQELEFDSSGLEVCDLALFSDGLERLALDFKTGEVHSAFLRGLFPYLYRRPAGQLEDVTSQMRDFLGSDRVNERTDDDKTLILATLENEDVP
jgi:hypothetical protein